MKQKKTMKLWQMIIILLLSIVMVVTMFLPAFRVDSKARRKQIDVINKNEELLEQLEKNYSPQSGDSLYTDPDSISESLDEMSEQAENTEGFGNEVSETPGTEGGSSETMIDEMEKELETYDEDIKEFEQEINTHIAKISPFRIMTKSFEKLTLGNKLLTEIVKIAENENSAYAAIKKSYNMSKILLWIIYISALLIIVIILLGFFLKWNKFIPLIISTVYGAAAAIIFGYLRFGYIRGIAKNVNGEDLGHLSWASTFGLTGLDGISSSYLAKLLSGFYSIAFLMAFIVAVIFIVMCVVSMFVGNRAASDSQDDEWGLGEDIQTIADGSIAVNGNNQFYGQVKEEAIPTQPVSDPIEPVFSQPVIVPQQPKAAPMPKAQPMGQVRCTKGAAAGQGFMLPQDKKVIVGKSQQNANLVINNQNISNVHCSIRYNPGTNTYIIKDHSMNGTFVNGVRLQKDAAIEYPSGTVLSLADGSNEITLG